MLYWQDAHGKEKSYVTKASHLMKMDERIKKLKLDRTAYLEELIDNDLRDSGNIIPMKVLAVNLGTVSESLDMLLKDIETIEDENYAYLKNRATEVERGMIKLWQSLN